MPARQSTFKVRKEQYWVAKNRGDNGDLVVGQVESVRTSGAVILINLLTSQTSTKRAKVLLVRNKYVTKRNALKVVRAFKDAKAAGQTEHAARQAAREVAVTLPEMARVNEGEAQLTLDLQPRRERTRRPRRETATAPTLAATPVEKASLRVRLVQLEAEAKALRFALGEV